MQATKFELTLENGEKIICSKAGNGPRIAYIPGGPGSFYLKGLEALQNEYTFITSDSIWTYRKPYGEFFTKKKIQDLTLEGIKKQDHFAVNALKKHFATDKVYGFGFSAPGALLFEQALSYPEDYCSLICTGVGVTPLDPTFTSTDKIFYAKASPERIKAYEAVQGEYKELQSRLQAPDPTPIDPKLLHKFNFKSDGKEAKKFKEKPHKDFVAGALAIRPKLLFDFKPATNPEEDLVIKHWKHNLSHEHVDKRFQEYFFTKLYGQLNPSAAIQELAKKGTPILLVYGDTDFVTPLPDETAKDLAKFPSVTLKIIPESAHITYMEKPKEHAKIVMDFVDPQLPMITSKL